MNNIQKIKSLERRIEELEQEQKDKVSWEYFVFFLVFLPVTIVGYVLVSLYYAFYKLFALFGLSKEEKKLYYLAGDFNPCEYMWSSITPRKESKQQEKCE